MMISPSKSRDFLEREVLRILAELKAHFPLLDRSADRFGHQRLRETKMREKR